MGSKHPWRDEETLRHYYIKRDLSAKDTGKHLGCSEMTVLNWLNRYDIPTRNGRNFDSEAPWRDKETLKELYVDNGLTIKEIAEKLDTSIDAIHRYLKKHDIPTRPHNLPGWNSNKVQTHATFSTRKDGYEVWTNRIVERAEVRVHRLLAVSKYGFKDVCGKVVHHKNGVKWDNRPENIELMERGEHRKHHYKNGDSGLKHSPKK